MEKNCRLGSIMEMAFRKCRYNPQVRNLLPSLAIAVTAAGKSMRVDRSRFLAWCLVASMHLHAGAAFAQESPLVPPWGRDLPPAESTPAPNISELPADQSAEASAHGASRFAGEYLLWWTKNARVPPLLTTGPTSDARSGALDQPFTKILYGDNVDFQERHGGRFMLEIPLGAGGEWSLAANYFLLTSRNVGVSLSSPGNPALARPFFDAVNLREDSSVEIGR